MPEVTEIPEPPDVPAIAAVVAEVSASVESVVVGAGRSLRLTMAALLAGGHVLLEDVPGLGKTLLASSLAQSLGLDFRRLQCTPDLLPADVTGSYLYDPTSREFAFRPGPIFTGLLLADEINRTPPKTQSVLLEAMQERQVTIEGTTMRLARPFHVLATANPVEYEGTYPLPEAQLDRFLLRLDIGYPAADEEAEVLRRRLARRREETSLSPVIDAGEFTALQAGIETVDVDPDVVRYCVDLASATRSHPAVEVGASPRGALALVLVGRALAVLDGRSFVLPEDVKECAVPALAHRLTLRPETWTTGVTGVEVVTELLGKVAGPATGRLRANRS
ncbi:AAA family ATPase [Actinoalloteichus sp. GBA129-24]|uniref:AAA family ATPase n=1 Tax=Actinoalloteichus sp. GBA129-24 TaxID=1612551 RepID=UPI000950ABC6|nr:MoxR family ATPase [Actinoalloteichus sp. GBA129-24]APU18809.1 MoxR-like ATPase [Actinoalloteichus sp. GBA129-24]